MQPGEGGSTVLQPEISCSETPLRSQGEKLHVTFVLSDVNNNYASAPPSYPEPIRQPGTEWAAIHVHPLQFRGPNALQRFGNKSRAEATERGLKETRAVLLHSFDTGTASR